jgi:hypothetical protein
MPMCCFCVSGKYDVDKVEDIRADIEEAMDISKEVHYLFGRGGQLMAEVECLSYSHSLPP